MTSRACSFIKPAILVIILCLLSAGCISGKDAKTPPAPPVPASYGGKGLTPSSTPQVTVVDDGSKTCSQLQGTVAIPGQVCGGRWLTVSDSFSCCSTTPLAGMTTKPRLVVEPLDLRLPHNDPFVAIGTG